MTLGIKTLVTLSSGATLPVLGFGTWRAEPGEVGKSVTEALKAGFRHIDCARIYDNEKEVGSAIVDYLAHHGVQRSDLWITSKLWCNDHRPERVEAACRATLKDLQLTYLDLYLIHWPSPFAPGDSTWPTDEKENLLTDSEVTLEQTWGAMEKLVEAGLVRNIGVSNFSAEQIKRISAGAKIRPVMNQVEVHPSLPQKALQRDCDALGVKLTAYCPLGVTEDNSVLAHPRIKQIAEKAGLSPAQLLLRWGLKNGNIVLTKSTTPARIAENAATPVDGLSDEIMQQIAEYSTKHPCRLIDPGFYAGGKKIFDDSPSKLQQE